jgi:carbon storage regulator CsrA
MLNLDRAVGEEILIDGGIVIRVCEIRGSRVRLGITAPQATKIWRAELDPEGRKRLAVEPREHPGGTP